MKLDAKITILINSDHTTIEIYDATSCIVLAKVELTPEQLSQALSRLGRVDCSVTTGNLSLIGKQREQKVLVFEYNESTRDQAALEKKCLEAMKEQGLSEYKPNLFFGSKDSFFTKDDKKFARTIIFRWVDKQVNRED